MEASITATIKDRKARRVPVLYVTPLRMVVPPGRRPLSSGAFRQAKWFTGSQADDDGSSRLKPLAPRGSPWSDNGHISDANIHIPTTDPCSSSPPKNKRRKNQSSIPTDAKRPKRSTGKPMPSAQGLNLDHPNKTVRATLRLYDAVRRNLLQAEEIKRKETRKGRADLSAGSILNQKGLFLNRRNKVVGPLPGVEVGDQFYFRMEICSIGLHGAIQAGIEYLRSKESEWNTSVAISIISAGRCDDRDDGETMIYTGQGGKAHSKKANEDQKLERGNLAMEGNMKFQVPVRVIRGIKDASSPSGKTYTYDGLYRVVNCWSEKGKTGFTEFKFKLQRLPGQPELGSAVIKLGNHLKYKPSMRKGLSQEDISRGIENVPVCVVNTVDDDENPPHFKYSNQVHYPCGFSELQLPVGCECKGDCSPSKRCLCFTRNGFEFAYLKSRVLVKEKDIVYECGSRCTCPPTCRNRLTQKGLKYRLEIFKTEKKGWGVRSWDSIPAGSFVCEYTGKAVNNLEDLHLIQSNDYGMNLRNMSINKTRWGQVSGIVENRFLKTNPGTMNRKSLLIDASEIGNVARFINHSCAPNLLIQPVLYDHHDLRFPHIMLFAMDNLPPMRELTFDYCSGEHITNSELRTKDCLCGALECRVKF